MGSVDQSSELCDHKVTTRTVTAGIERTVCENCGHVSLRYHDQGAFLPVKPSGDVVDLTEAPSQKPETRQCTACEAPPVFLTPYGVACNKHAWIAASKQDSQADEIWIPLLIDRTAKRTSNQ
jgi:hypothetical protein